MIKSTTYIGVKEGELDFIHVGSHDTGGEPNISLNWTFSDAAVELIRQYNQKQERVKRRKLGLKETA